MKIYTVHGPRKLTGDATRDAERFAFVRDGFHFWAFVFGPLWMLWRRLWLVLLIYLVFTVAVQAGLWAIGASAPVKFAVGFLIALLIGFEASTLRRWTLRKRNYLGVVVGRDQEDAERRFFDAWVKDDELPPVNARPSTPPSNLPPAPVLPMSSPPPSSYPASSASNEVIGLFPEPEPRR